MSNNVTDGPGLATRWLGALAAFCLRVLGRTWRIRVEGKSPFDAPDPIVLGAIWHHALFIAAVVFQRSGIAVPVSRSRDGERIAVVLRRLGFADPPRGSTSRGGATAFRHMLSTLRGGGSVAILTDGPRGPARRSKPGVIALSSRSGVSITPASFSARPCLRFRSWDETLLPLPFARVVCRYGDAFPVAPDLGSDAASEAAAQLDRILERDTRALDQALGVRTNRS